MCLYPKVIKNPKYLSSKKNGGVIPPITDERVKYVPIGCKQCIECRKQTAREWQVRLMEDIKTHKNGKFITLTFSNEKYKEINEKIDNTLEGYERDNEIATYAVRHFLENWRKRYKKSLRHWLVTELGHNGTENIHIHGIIWVNDVVTRWKGRGKKRTEIKTRGIDEIQNLWQYGFVWKGKKVLDKVINYVNAQTVNYIVKYVNKVDQKHQLYRSKILTSAGIGGAYVKTRNAQLNRYKGTKTKETYTTSTGHEIAMPVYWRNKIYTETEREKLWLIKLDKQERWVCGERIDISKGEEHYYKILKHHRERNRKLGYGNGEISWSRKVYETERRLLMQETRIRNALIKQAA